MAIESVVHFIKLYDNDLLDIFFVERILGLACHA